MPVEDKSLPPVPDLFKGRPSEDGDLVDQVRKATYSPSPLIRVLQDPTILPTKKAQGKNEHKSHHSRSSSRHREHRSPVVAAIAIAEEERHAKQLKALLRASGDRLEYEIKRAEDANARADYAERQEKEALARARAANVATEEIQVESMRLERDARNYQLQLEEAQMETRQLHDDLEHAHREIDELREAESKAQDLLQSYQKQLHDLELMMMERTAAVQRIVDQSYDDGWQAGYEQGYEDGRRAGRKIRRRRRRDETSTIDDEEYGSS